jgi:hypothetical protein
MRGAGINIPPRLKPGKSSITDRGDLPKGAVDAKVFVEVGNADSSSGCDGLNVSDAEKFLDYLLWKHRGCDRMPILV